MDISVCSECNEIRGRCQQCPAESLQSAGQLFEFVRVSGWRHKLYFLNLFDTFCTLEVLLELLNLRCRTAFILACLLEEFVQSVTDRLLEQWIEEEAHGWTCNGIASQSDFALFPDAFLLPRFPCLCFYVLLLANSGIFDGYTRRGPC